MLRIHLDVDLGPRPPYPPCEQPHGCVLAAPVPRAFGFARAAQWAVGTLCVLLLMLFFFLGHEVEVLIGIAVAVAAAGATELLRPSRRQGGAL